MNIYRAVEGDRRHYIFSNEPVDDIYFVLLAHQSHTVQPSEAVFEHSTWVILQSTPE